MPNPAPPHDVASMTEPRSTGRLASSLAMRMRILSNAISAGDGFARSEALTCVALTAGRWMSTATRSSFRVGSRRGHIRPAAVRASRRSASEIRRPGSRCGRATGSWTPGATAVADARRPEPHAGIRTRFRPQPRADGRVSCGRLKPEGVVALRLMRPRLGGDDQFASRGTRMPRMLGRSPARIRARAAGQRRRARRRVAAAHPRVGYRAQPSAHAPDGPTRLPSQSLVALPAVWPPVAGPHSQPLRRAWLPQMRRRATRENPCQGAVRAIPAGPLSRHRSAVARNA